MKNSLKKLDYKFNRLSMIARLGLMILFFFLLFSFIDFAKWINSSIRDYINAEKYQISVENYKFYDAQSKKFNMSFEVFLDELRKSKKMGYESFDDYVESKAFGNLNSDEFFAIKKLGRSKTDWESDKAKMAEKGMSIPQYLAFVEAEDLRMATERKNEEEKRKRLAKEAVACHAAVDDYLRSWNYVFNWDKLGFAEIKFFEYDSSFDSQYGKYSTNKVSVQTAPGLFSRRKINCFFNRSSEKVSFEIW